MGHWSGVADVREILLLQKCFYRLPIPRCVNSSLAWSMIETAQAPFRHDLIYFEIKLEASLPQDSQKSRSNLLVIPSFRLN